MKGESVQHRKAVNWKQGRGVRGLNIVHFPLLNSGIWWLLWVLCRIWSLPSRACETWRLQPQEDWTCQAWAGNLPARQAGFSWNFDEKDMKRFFSAKHLIFRGFHSYFNEGLLMGTFVTEVPLDWVILCLGRRQHWAALCLFFLFFWTISTSFKASGEALILMCPSSAPQLHKLRKQKCFLDKTPHNYRPWTQESTGSAIGICLCFPNNRQPVG